MVRPIPMWRLRLLRAQARAKKRCAVIGHRMMFTCGSMSVMGKTIQADSGRICVCGYYEKISEWHDPEYLNTRTA